MTDVFTRIRGRASAVIQRFGSPVGFTIPGAELVYQPSTGLWTGTEGTEAYSGFGIETKGQADKLASMGLILVNPVVILVDAITLKNIADSTKFGVPKTGMIMTWANVQYNVQPVLPVEPNGVPIYFIVWGTA